MSRQLSLFSPSEYPAPVGAATISPEVSALASGLTPTLYFGTCSWSFPGWKTLVYDRAASQKTLARHGLAAYARHPMLRTVCLDRTYYGPISADAFRSYALQVPESFRFVVKAHEYLTRADTPHYLDPRYAEQEVLGPCMEGLRDRIAAVIFQFPPQAKRKHEPPARFAEALHRFLTSLRSELDYAVELRNHELLTNSYVQALADAGASHAFNVHPTMPSVAEQRRLVDPSRFKAIVIRWMLRRDRGYAEALDAFRPFDRIVAPDDASRSAIAALCREAGRRGQQAFVLVNNKAEGSAPESLIRLADAVVNGT